MKTAVSIFLVLVVVIGLFFVLSPVSGNDIIVADQTEQAKEIEVTLVPSQTLMQESEPVFTETPIVVPTETDVPTSTPTLVPTVEPTPTVKVCTVKKVLRLNGVKGLKAETFIRLEESMFEQVALYNEANGTDLVPRSLIETFGECEAPEGGFKVVPLMDNEGNLTGQYFVLDRDGYCLLDSGCDIVFFVIDLSLVTGLNKTPEERAAEEPSFSRLGGALVLQRSSGDSLTGLLHYDDEHRAPPGYNEPYPLIFLMDGEFFSDEYKREIRYVGVSFRDS